MSDVIEFGCPQVVAAQNQITDLVGALPEQPADIAELRRSVHESVLSLEADGSDIDQMVLMIAGKALEQRLRRSAVTRRLVQDCFRWMGGTLDDPTHALVNPYPSTMTAAHHNLQRPIRPREARKLYVRGCASWGEDGVGVAW